MLKYDFRTTDTDRYDVYRSNNTGKTAPVVYLVASEVSFHASIYTSRFYSILNYTNDLLLTYII